MRRYVRQTRLAAIGEAGQAKLAAADAIVSRGFSGWVEARYLVGAGVGRVTHGEHEAIDARFDALDRSAREVALGAHEAVLAIMKIVR